MEQTAMDRTAEERDLIAACYTRLARKGFFTDRLGGNEQYAGGLMLDSIPMDATSILEIGGGTGLFMEWVLRARPNIQEVFAVEISDMAITYHSRVNAVMTHRGGTCMVKQKDFLEVLKELPQCEVVVSSFVAAYMGDPTDYLNMLGDLTAPGGVVIALDEIRNAGDANLAKMLQSVGMIYSAHLRGHRLPPFLGLARSSRLNKLYTDPDFKTLEAIYGDNVLSLEGWMTEAQRFPDSHFTNLGMAALLVFPRRQQSDGAYLS